MYFQLFEASVQNQKTQKGNLRTGSIEIEHIEQTPLRYAFNENDQSITHISMRIWSVAQKGTYFSFKFAGKYSRYGLHCVQVK